MTPGFSGRNGARLHALQATRENTSRRAARIVLADIHTLFRAGLRKLLMSEEQFDVVAETGNGSDIPHLLEEFRPDVLLLDVGLHELSGLDVLRELQAAGHCSCTRILILTACEDQNKLAEAMQLGASGVVLKTTPTEMLVEAIHRVLDGEIWLDSRVSADLIRNLAAPPAPSGRGQDDLCGLTPREREVAALVGQGYKYREIAAMLSISEQTVKNHLRNMFHKLGVSDRLQLALFAIHHHL